METTRILLHSLKISWTLLHKRLKIAPEFLPILGILFRPQSIAHALSSINMAPHSDLNKTVLGLSAAQIRSPEKILTLQWHHVGWHQVAMR